MKYKKEKGFAKPIGIFLLTVGIIFIAAYGAASFQNTKQKQGAASSDLHYDTEKNHASEEPYSAFVKGIKLSLYEEKGAILEKLKEGGISYTDSENSILADDSLYLYFDENDKCQRMRFLTSSPQIGLGVHKGNSVYKMKEIYGEPCEKTITTHKGKYITYRYCVDDFILEFGMAPCNLSLIYNLDIYNRKLYPVYGEWDLIYKEPNGLSSFYFNF